MAKIVGLPDGTDAEFPDSMSDDDIKSVLSKKFPKPKQSPTVGQEMEAQAQDRPWETGIATAASKAVRGVGTLLLPKAAEAWAEKRGYLPTEEDIKLLEQGTASSGKAQAANLAGEVALTAVPGAGAYRGAVGVLPRVLPRAGRFTQASVGGAAAGAAGAATMGEDPVAGALLGSVMGPAGTAIGDVGGWTWTHGRRLFERPSTGAARYMQEISADPAADAAVLRSLRGLVPGEQPTVGMAATVDPRMVYLKEIEEQASRRLGGQAEAIRQGNEAARAAPLEAIAAPGTPGFDRATRTVIPSEAEALRSRVTTPIYGRAMPDRVTVDPNLGRVLEGAEVIPSTATGARQFAQEQSNAAVAGRTPNFGPTANVEREIVRDASTGATMNPSGPFMPQQGTYSIEQLQLVRRNLDDKIESAVRQGDMVTARRLGEARRQLSGEMEGQSGNFALANTMFRNLSAPQNQADVAQVLLDALRSPTGKERASTFLNARRNAPQTLRRADQSPRFTHEGEVFTPEQLRQVDAVTNSLRRQSAYEALPRTELPGVMSPAEHLEGAIPNLWERTISIAKKGLNRLGIRSEEQIRQVIDEAALDPQRMAQLLETIPPSDRVPFLSAMRQMNPKGAIIGTVAGQ